MEGAAGADASVQDASGGGPADASAAQDADAEASVKPIACTLKLAGDPAPFLSFPGATADSSEIVVIDPGTQSSAAVVAVKARNADANMWHPEIHVARLRIGKDWPSGVETEKPLTLFAFEAHEWGQMSRAPGAMANLAMLWGYAGALVDPVSVRFRTFDTSSWSPGPIVDVIVEHGTATCLVPGRGVAASGGAWEGEGYGATWRGPYVEDAGTQPYMAVLSAAGALQLGPFAAASPAPYPGRETQMIWSGSTYLVATSFDACASSEPFCVPDTTAVYALTPVAGGSVKDMMQLKTAIPILPSSLVPGAPHVAAYAGRVFVAWVEKAEADSGAPRAVRLAVLDAGGVLQGEVRTIAADAQPTHAIFLGASELGVVLFWPEEGDPSKQPQEVGYQVIRVHHLDDAGHPMQAPLEIETTGIDYYGGTFAATLANPRSILMSWAAKTYSAPTAGSIWLARADCL